MGSRLKVFKISETPETKRAKEKKEKGWDPLETLTSPYNTILAVAPPVPGSTDGRGPRGNGICKCSFDFFRSQDFLKGKLWFTESKVKYLGHLISKSSRKLKS